MISKWSLETNMEQRHAFMIVIEHMLHNDPEQMLMFITGIGRSGKSHLIRVIVDVFAQKGHSREILLSAPTGSAACLIDGFMIHALTLMNSQSMGDANQQTVDMDELQEIWHDVTYLVLDEVSMVSMELLANIAKWISLAKAGEPERRDKPFGGINIIFMGGMVQLRPINGTVLYSHAVVNNLSRCMFETVKAQRHLFGAFLWRSLTHVVQLVQNEHAKADLTFIEMLGWIRLGSATMSVGSPPSDWHHLQQRLLSELHKNSIDDFLHFSEAPIVFGEC
ncbi:hypothetical protein M404DRAFT_156400 [Pisolithus tinctorius Marx 270]|uniref:ATP-dependent DNA helicase n=1 Tax=Pisolithus tinctorius Marx 270 TaxID=870435 RepID=A0A0C3NUU1_PISTI|nr:hypothetical protein M404DRAFT_156400 [Pisolithus tinctorius Marx 270]